MTQYQPIEVERERAQFKDLVLRNPEQFQLSGLAGPAALQSSTKYEELTCVGYNPHLSHLEGTVQIKLPVGYGGRLCGPGTTEFVRFFVDYGSGFSDVGAVAFNVHDIPDGADCAKQDTLPLSYVVTLPLDPKTDFCGNPVLPNVRAILAWEVLPSTDPNQAAPFWGNILEAHIQITPRPPYVIDIVNEVIQLGGKVQKLPPQFEALANVPILPPKPDPDPLPLTSLVALYSGAKTSAVATQAVVQPHRFALADVHALRTSGAFSMQQVQTKVAEFKAVGLELGEVLGALENTSGDISYEELDCLGLDPNREWLAATLRIKLSSGYSGGLCGPGSQEHVAFWADWDDTCRWTYLGTVDIAVHDITKLPSDGLHYTAVLPVQLDTYRRPCDQPKVGRVRAVLSWSVPPSTVDPDAIPFWGNRLEAHVQIRPGDPSDGSLTPEIKIVGGVNLGQIDTAPGGTGMTLPGAHFAEYFLTTDPRGLNRPCPFGGTIHVQTNVPDILSTLGYKYRIVTRRFGTLTEIPLTDSFPTSNGIVTTLRTPDALGRVAYLPYSQNILSMLGAWQTSGDAAWEVRLEMLDGFNAFLAATPWFKIQLDNTPPSVDLQITTINIDCVVTKPTVVQGTFEANDLHFGEFSLSTSPGTLSPPSPISTWLPDTTQTPGPKVWTLDTATMQPCGYVVRLDAYDLSILASGPFARGHNATDRGLCVKAE